MNAKPEEPRVHGPFPLWIIVIRQPKDPDTPRGSLTPDPKKPTTQAPEMIVRTKIPMLNRKRDGNLLTEKEAEQMFRLFVQKNRGRFPEDHSYSLERIDFWDVEGVPELAEFCPDHPGQKENFCGHCGRPADTSLKTT